MVVIMDNDNKFVTNVASIGMMLIAYSRGMGHQNMLYPLTEDISAHIYASIINLNLHILLGISHTLFKNFCRLFLIQVFSN